MEHLSTKICPYLGLREDSTTPVGYPSTRNVCFHSKKHEIPNLTYQRSTCLGGRFRRCPLLNSEEEKWMPRSIRYRSGKFLHFLSEYKRFFLIGFLIITVGSALVFYRQWIPNISQALIPSWQKTQQFRTFQPSQTLRVTRTSDDDSAEQITPTLIFSETAAPTPIYTPTMTLLPPVLSLDTPIGSDVQFIIHRTLVGESLFQYAREYSTNVDAIEAVNYELPPVLYVDLIVVIPIGVDDTAGLPQFEAYQVTMRGLTVDSLAEQLAGNPDSLAKYNNVPRDYKFNPGDWILVPRE